MSSPRSFNSLKPWFKKRTSHNNSLNKTYENVATADDKPVSGYYGFKLYFPVLEENEIKPTIDRVTAFKNFIERNTLSYPLDEIKQNKCFFVDYNHITHDTEFEVEWPNFKTELTDNADYCFNCMSLAMHQCLMLQIEEKQSKDEEQINTYSFHISSVRARIYNYEPILSIKDLKTHYFGKLVCVRGTVIKARNKRLLCQHMAFQCSACGGTEIVKQIGGLFTPPLQCATENCKVRSNFKPLLSSPYTRTVDWQSIKIQELIDDTQGENGRVPRAYDCELTGDLLNSCTPGDDVVLMGVVKRRTSETSTDKRQIALFQFYLDVVSVINNKSEGQAGQIIFNSMDYSAIKKVHGEPGLFRFLVHSLCPTIYGNEIVKAGLLLALFGGTKNEESLENSNVRSHSHVLMVGDPGLGKSQMLQACTSVAPRGVYVCGKASTASGLTVTVSRDSGGEYSLEAGALVLADQGCCCIDEFDKMSAQHECLLEAMEQQSVSIAKAGIICTLPTRTTVLAAANPVEGHYNKTRTIGNNLKIRPAVLSRFDLVFILLDKPDLERDKLLPKHVLGLHMGTKYKHRTVRRMESVNNPTSGYTCLNDCLKLQTDEHIDNLPHVLFRKYIAYSQRYIKPELSKEAKQVLKKFYLELRKQYQNDNCTPVTIRQLHSLIRLTQGRAKIELREEATEQDALDVVEIMKYCLIDVSSESATETSALRSQKNLKSVSRNQVNSLLDSLKSKAEERSNRIFSIEELKYFCEVAGISGSKISTTLDTLNVQGFLLNKGQGNYQLVTSALI